MPLLRSKSTVRPFPYVFAVSTLGVGLENGMVIHLVRGSVWASDDPLVVQRPELFADAPFELCRTTPPTTLGELRVVS
jgi:hypothetical protein